MGDGVVVIGASLAGLTATDTLRRSGWDGAITLVDPAGQVPADRPPLSKQVLAGEWEPDRAVHRVTERLPELDVDLRLGTAAVSLDASRRRLTLSDDSVLDADGVVIATGASPRRLPDAPGAGAGVHVLRTLGDCLALRDELDAGVDRVLVVGAGFIGAEVAATCRGRGHEVTLVEAAPVPLGRVLPAEVGGFVADLHRSHGVDVRLGTGVDAFDTDAGGRVRRVRLGDGDTVEASVVVAGIGVTPDTAWLEGSGLTLDDGVRCDATCRAAEGIVAAGDVASWHNPRYDEVMRVEQWENAIEMGEHAARRLLADLGAGDHPGDFASIPWFWSDQFDRKIQMAGRPSGSDEMVVVEGDVDGSVEDPRFVVLFRRGETCSAVLGVNRPRHVMTARMAMAESRDWQPVAELFA